MQDITRRGLFAATTWGILATPGHTRAQGPYQGRQLVAEVPNGSLGMLKSVAFDPFDAANSTTTTLVPMSSSSAFARMRVEASAPQIDLYMFSGRQELLAADEGLLAELGQVPDLADVPAQLRDPDGRWVALAGIAECFLYRTDKVKEPPRRYTDLLRPEFFGHIAVPTITNGYGADLLVMLARAYGGSERDVDRGFEAMAKLAAHATVFNTTSDLNRLLEQEDIWVAPYDVSTAFRAQQQGLPISFVTPEEGSPGIIIRLCLARNAPDLDLARQAIGRLLSPDVQLQFAEQQNWAPANSRVELPAALRDRLPRTDQFVVLDERYIAEHLPQWLERWNREVLR